MPVGTFSKSKHSQSRAEKRFNPGIWWNIKSTNQPSLALDGSGRIADAAWTAMVNKISPIRAIKGYAHRMRWLEIEPSFGVYSGIDLLEQACVELKEINKGFMLLFPTRTFTVSSIAPDYAKTPEYSGGEHDYGTAPTVSGRNINWYTPLVQARMQAIAEVLANRLVLHSNFLGICLMETAHGNRITDGLDDPMSGAEETAFYQGQQKFTAAAKTAQPRLQIIQYVNTRTIMNTYVPEMVAKGVGLGGPDLWTEPENNGGNINVWNPGGGTVGSYQWHGTYHNVIPKLIHIQPDNFRWPTKVGIGPNVPTADELLAAARTATIPNLRVNYLLVTADNGGDANPRGGNYPDFEAEWLAKLQEPGQRDTLSAGMNAVRPSNM